MSKISKNADSIYGDNYLKYRSPEHETSTIRREIMISPWENLSFQFELSVFKENSIFWRKLPFRYFNVKIKTSSPPTPYYSLSLHILWIYALRVTPRYQTQQGKWSLTTPGYAGSAGMTIWEIAFLMKYDAAYVYYYFSLFSLFWPYRELKLKQINKNDVQIRFWTDSDSIR